MRRTIVVLISVLVATVLVACSGGSSEPSPEAADPAQEEFPELSEVDQLLSELDELDEQLALDSDLEEMDLALE